MQSSMIRNDNYNNAAESTPWMARPPSNDSTSIDPELPLEHTADVTVKGEYGSGYLGNPVALSAGGS